MPQTSRPLRAAAAAAILSILKSRLAGAALPSSSDDPNLPPARNASLEAGALAPSSFGPSSRRELGSRAPRERAECAAAGHALEVAWLNLGSGSTPSAGKARAANASAVGLGFGLGATAGLHF